MNPSTRHHWLLSLLAASVGAYAKDPTDQLPPNLIAYKAPVYPAELKGLASSGGYTTIAFVVRADGRIGEAVVLEATDPAFGNALLDVLPEWRFEKPQAPANREVVRFVFQQTGAIASLSHRDATKAAFPLSDSERLPIRTVQWPKLATPPERLAARMPDVTSDRRGKVVVSYIIDTHGNVRVPAIVEGDEPELAAAVLDAIKEWRFAPPMHAGEPVLVEDQRSFIFAARKTD